MDATFSATSTNQTLSQESIDEKSELMLFFENQVNDAFWAYKDLLIEIVTFDKET
jgi:hypothetical protein